MIYKNKPECKTVGTWIPLETYEALLKLADARTERTGQWWSMSRLIREILINAMEVDHGKRA